MKKRWFAIGTAAAVVLLLLLYFSHQHGAKKEIATTSRTISAQSQPAMSSSPQVSVQPIVIPDVPGANLTPKDKERIGKIVTVFSAPISFFGKVVDQTGQPVAGAKVHYSAADRYFGDSSKYEGISDTDGFFSITGIKGAGLYVSVYKDGYDGTKQSGDSFGYGMASGSQPPSKESPAIFVLRKKGPAEPLAVVSSRQYETPKDGTIVGVNLKTGRKVTANDADITMQSWINDQSMNEKHRFDWKARIAAPGGGLTERNDPLLFQAPEGGYQPHDEVGMPASSANWKNRLAKEYFLKLRDSTYARVKIELVAGGHYNFFVLESYLNPSGSQNLEFDPKKALKPESY